MPLPATESVPSTVRAHARRPLPAMLLLPLLFASLPPALSANGYPPPPGSYRSLDQPAPTFSAAERPQSAIPETATPGTAARQPFAASNLFGAPAPALRPPSRLPQTPPAAPAGTPQRSDFSMDFRKPARPPNAPGGRPPVDYAGAAAWPPARDSGRPRYPAAPLQTPVRVPGAAATMRPPTGGDDGKRRFSTDAPGSPTARRPERPPASTAEPAPAQQQNMVFRPAG